MLKFLISVLASCFISVICYSSTYVVMNTNDSGPESLRHFVGIAQQGDTILFHNSLGGSTIALTTGPIIINNGMQILGLIDTITLDGMGSSRIFNINNNGGLTTLRNLKMINGYDLFSGGAIRVFGEALIENCRITNCTTNGSGGGIEVNNTTIIQSSKIDHNTSHNRGGGINLTAGLEVFDSKICNNSCISQGSNAHGGGISGFSGALLTMHESMVNNNIVGINGQGLGGGLYFGFDCDFNIYRSSIINNQAYIEDTVNWGAYGGGLYLQYDGNGLISNSTISGNHTESNASSSGGGIYYFAFNGNTGNSSLYLENVTISENSCLSRNGLGFGGGLLAENNSSTLDSARLKNCIIAGNNLDNSHAFTGKDVRGNFSLAWGNFIQEQGTATFDYELGSGSEHLGVDPEISPLNSAGFHPFQCNSFAIDKGSISGLSPTLDQRGAPRVYNALVDPGSLEFHPASADLGTDTMLCLGDELLFQIGFTGDSVLWYDSDQLVGTTNTFNYETLNHLADTIITVLVNASVCQSDRDTIIITPIEFPVLTVENSQIQACLGDSITLTASSPSIQTFNWSGDIENGVFFNPDSSQTYLVVGTDACGISITDSVTVDVVSSHFSAISDTTSSDDYVSPSGNYVWTESGIYQDTLLSTFGCDSVVEISLYFQNTVGIQTQHLEKISVYPNPVNGSTFIVEWNNKENGKIELIDMTGRSIYQRQLVESQTKISVNKSLSGTYIIKLSNGKDFYFRKIIF